MNAKQILSNPIEHYPKATVACFDATTGDLPRRKLDVRRNAEFLNRLAKAGVPGVLIGASTGHGHLRTVEELEEWFGASAEAELGDTVKMALLRPEDGRGANGRLIRQLRQWGYAVIFARPGTNLAPGATANDIYKNMRPIVEEASVHGLAVGLYSIPDVSGVPMPADTAAMLVNGPGGEQIVAIKVTEADYNASTLQFLQHPQLKNLKIVQGWDPHLSRALRDGVRAVGGQQRCGVTSGPMSLAVYQYLHIFAAAGCDDWDEVAAAQASVTALFQAMQDDPLKFADLQRAKYIMGLGHPLTSTVTDEQVERVLAALESLPREADRRRLARSLDLMSDGPYHERLAKLA